jgi:pilus assembly protein CpaB
MSLRAFFIVASALVCGGSAAVGVNRYLNQSTPVSDTEPLVVAAVDLPRGHMVSASEVQVRDWPRGMLPPGAIADAADAVDRATLVPLVVGEPILNSKIAEKNAGRGLAALVPKGMRAYTIQASRVASNVAGFILPGNKVDVLLNLRGNPTDETGGGSTTTLLQSVEILAVDQHLDAPADNKVNPKDLGSVTLLVTPAQAALLDLGQNLGQLTLSLRNPEDQAAAATRPATVNDVRYRQEKPFDFKKLLLPLLSAAKHEPPPQTAKEPPEESLGIATLRGTQRGYVQIKVSH